MIKPSGNSRIVSSPDVPLDLARFNDLTAGDAEFAVDLVSAFADSGNQQLAEIGQALETSDRGAVARAAHAVKGASANIYAQPLAELAARLETEAPNADLGQLRQMVDALRREFNRANDFLAKQLAAPS